MLAGQAWIPRRGLYHKLEVGQAQGAVHKSTFNHMGQHHLQVLVCGGRHVCGLPLESSQTPGRSGQVDQYAHSTLQVWPGHACSMGWAQGAVHRSASNHMGQYTCLQPHSTTGSHQLHKGILGPCVKPLWQVSYLSLSHPNP